MVDKCKHLKEIKQKGFSMGIINQPPLKLATQFGKITSQYQGELVYSIKPDPLMENYYVSTNRKELFPHSEAYEFETPPKYIILICNEPDKFGLGENYLSDMYKFLLLLTDSEFKFITTQNMSCPGIGLHKKSGHNVKKS